MTIIKKIDQKACKVLRESVEDALRAVEEKHGVHIKVGGGSYDPAGFFNPKVTISVEGEDGEVMTAEATAFLRYCFRIPGLQEDDLWREFNHNGRRVKLVGYRSRARKQPMVIEDLTNGKKYVTTEESVVRSICNSVVGREIPKAVLGSNL